MPKIKSDRGLLKLLQERAAAEGRNPANVAAILYRRRRYAEDPAYRERMRAATRARRAAAEAAESDWSDVDP